MTERLVDGYDLVIFDLDGVIYLIDKPIPGAAEAVERLRAEGTADRVRDEQRVAPRRGRRRRC